MIIIIALEELLGAQLVVSLKYKYIGHFELRDIVASQLEKRLCVVCGLTADVWRHWAHWRTVCARLIENRIATDSLLGRRIRSESREPLQAQH